MIPTDMGLFSVGGKATTAGVVAHFGDRKIEVFTMAFKTLSLFLLLFASTAAQAGGSISREDAAKEVCAESANLCVLFQHISLEPAGNAVRLPDGSRIMPYEFNARIHGMATWVVMNRDEKGHIVLEIR